ncbi:MAG: UvrD-helicase domain-containing protein [Bacteroidetes bacterium]|nr:UvrD-helicase domain-containing protein [Bacteroidota bacterium]
MSMTIYRASAGSGKTYTLTRAFVERLLEQNHPQAYLHQLALTFTRNATEEMKTRILDYLNELSLAPEEGKRGQAVALRSAILHDYGRFSVYTIDAFFQKVVHSFIWEAGLPPAYTIELDSQRLLQEAIDEVVDEVATHGQNRKWIGAMLSEWIQEGKRWNVQEALAEVGKQVFDERFRSFGADLMDKLCDKEYLFAYMQELRDWDVHFCRQMEAHAEEVISFLSDHGLSTTDFKGKSLSFMRYFNKVKGGEYLPPNTLRKALNDESAWSGKNDPKASQIEAILGSLRSLIQPCMDFYDAEAPTRIALKSTLELLPQMGLAADIVRHINTLLANDNAVHLSQTLLLLSKLTAQSDAPFVLERMGCRYSDFLLDEFQDTSVLQWNSLLPLVHNGLSQGGVSWVVGDVKQSIYRWRNSDWQILGGGMEEDLCVYKDKIKRKVLKQNWRSREVLVNTVGSLFEQLTATFANEEITKAYNDVKQDVAPNKAGSGGYVSITKVVPVKEPTKEQSAKERVLERLPFLIIELQKRGFLPSDIAILVRKNDHGQQITSALMAFKERPEARGYCFEVVSPDSLFLDRSPEVQLIVAIFKRFVFPCDGLNNRLIEQLCIQLNTPCPPTLWSGPLQYYSLPEAFEEVIRILGWTERASSFPFIQELHNQILNFAKKSPGDLFSFVRWWEQNGNRVTLSLPLSGSAINILTIHKSKGLEYPVVVIPFCDWELDYRSVQAPVLWVRPTKPPLNRLPLIPQRYSSQMAQSLFTQDYVHEKIQYQIDQLNVFYVAATRAIDELHLFLPQAGNAPQSLARILGNQLFVEGEYTDNSEPDCRTFGAPVYPVRAPSREKETGYLLTQYASSVPTLRLRTRLADETPEAASTSPRTQGVILHALLSKIRTSDDIDTAVAALVQEGVLSRDKTEQAQYVATLRGALSQPQALGWFDGSWILRNEASILLPSERSRTIRPDRVMEKEGRTLIIDYKFGKPVPAHQRQMEEYIQALHQMGYKQVEGYVWYIPVFPLSSPPEKSKTQ